MCSEGEESHSLVVSSMLAPKVEFSHLVSEAKHPVSDLISNETTNHNINAVQQTIDLFPPWKPIKGNRHPDYPSVLPTVHNHLHMHSPLLLSLLRLRHQPLQLHCHFFARVVGAEGHRLSSIVDGNYR